MLLGWRLATANTWLGLLRKPRVAAPRPLADSSHVTYVAANACGRKLFAWVVPASCFVERLVVVPLSSLLFLGIWLL